MSLDSISADGKDQVISAMEVSLSNPYDSRVLEWKGIWLTLKGDVAEEEISHISIYKDLNGNLGPDSMDYQMGVGQFDHSTARIVFDEIDTLDTIPMTYLLTVRLDSQYALPGSQIYVCLKDSSAFLCSYPGIVVLNPTPYCTDTILIGQSTRMENCPTTLLSDPYPNPARESCRIRYYLHQQAWVKMKVINSSGKVVYISDRSWQLPGAHELSMDVSSLDNGLYCCTIQIGETNYTNRIIVLH